MSRAANPSVIGAFVLGAVFLGVAAVLLFGSGTFFEQRTTYVLNFAHSVQGLDVGSPVIFQGVEIGTVKSISALVNQETRVVAIPVYVEIVRGRVQIIGKLGDSVGGVEEAVKHGLRARLKSLSLITGKLYVDLDYYPDKPAVFKHLDPETPEIPTIPSELEELRASFQGFFHKIEKLPLSELIDKLASAAASLDKLLKKPELDDAIDQLDGTLTEARGTLTKLNARVDPLADSVEATLKRARSAIQAAQEAVAAVKGMVEPGSPVQYELIAALEEVERAARSVRMLADGLSQQPNSVIFGKEKAGN